MAAKRVAKSLVDWAAFAERVPPNQVEAFKALQAKTNGFVGKVYNFPDKLPTIDWAYYRSQIAAPGLVDQFQKGYEAVAAAIPYPKDTKNIKGQVDEQQKQATGQIEKHVTELKKQVAELKAMEKALDTLPPYDELSLDMYGYYFPYALRQNKPTTVFPHAKSWQPGAPHVRI